MLGGEKVEMFAFQLQRIPTINPAETTILRLTSKKESCVEHLHKSVVRRLPFEVFTSPMTSFHLFEKINKLLLGHGKTTILSEPQKTTLCVSKTEVLKVVGTPNGKQQMRQQMYRCSNKQMVGI